jgi:alginate O-acetyltransferase complex protein AlgI
MLFNTLNFAFFLPVVFLLYWLLNNRNLKWQNLLLLVSSYFFYACWDWRFLFLLIFSTLLDFFTGLKMEEAKDAKRKTFWFWLSVSINLGFLGVFKYYNFFATSFAEALAQAGLQVNPWTLKVILPVGISFYTFHGLSYVIDIYKNRIKAERSFIDYSVFVSFFPLLVAGPIERATHLLPQIKHKRTFSYAQSVDGLKQILWGLFKKIVIADQCAEYANTIFAHSADYSGSTLFLGGMFFAFQIYGDFSGYSDIALGTARLFGIELLRNFSFPYFSRDIAEFWRRWHISLSTWFRDYLYIPLGGSQGGRWGESEKHVYHISCKWFLAWSELDVYRLGLAECYLHNAFHLV